MRLVLVSAAVLAVAATLASAGAAQAGCLGGAVVGGVGGHFAGRHAGVGALAGCAVGHHMAVQHRRDRAVARNRGYYDSHHHFPPELSRLRLKFGRGRDTLAVRSCQRAEGSLRCAFPRWLP